jgi:mannose-6-phosphate isomerase-like protein (cupin superfamily)
MTMRVRRFSADLKTKVPGGHHGLYAVPIQLDRANVQDEQALAARMNGLPILLDRPMVVAAHYLEPHGQMDEHMADVPILVLVVAGHGFTRVGGPQGETRAVGPGDAILWPARQDHTIWTEDGPLETIVIDGPGEREQE